MAFLRATARKIGLGKALRHLYYRPVGLSKKCLEEGGPWEQLKTASGEKKMISAASEIGPYPEPSIGPKAEVSYLTGPRFWHQTLFCFLSLQRVTPFRITPIIYSDGNLDDATVDKIKQTIPWARFELTDQLEDRLDRMLPEKAFPTLRKRRSEYPHLRKLIDLHLPRQEFTLVADSDMLFFREPADLLDWFHEPYPFFIEDVDTYYGYSIQFLKEMLGKPVPERVNVGLYGLNSAAIDWDQLEFWCAKQVETFGGHYLQEQALTAMVLAAGKPPRALGLEYRVKPPLSEGKNPTAILHHYVAESKRTYFQKNWQRILAEINAG